MQEQPAATYQYLLQRYGPLLTTVHVAELLHTTPRGLRMALERGGNPFSRGLAAGRRRLGRRVYFEARIVATLIDATPQDASRTFAPTQPV